MLNVFGFNKKKGAKAEPEKLDFETLEMINNIKDLKDTTAREVMVPRIDVFSVKLKTGLRDVINNMRESGYSRLPVFNKTVDDIVGIIYIKDLFNKIVDGADPDKGVLENDMMKKAYFVPETKKINVLLREFQRKKIHLAVVVDEYGGFSGIVTLEDILEEIVGEIQDEYDQEEEEIIRIDKNTFNCDARCDIEELNEILEIGLPTENIDTLGGFVYNLFGKIPTKDETASYENVDFKIYNINKNIIERILITVHEKPIEDELEN